MLSLSSTIRRFRIGVSRLVSQHRPVLENRNHLQSSLKIEMPLLRARSLTPYPKPPLHLIILSLTYLPTKLKIPVTGGEILPMIFIRRSFGFFIPSIFLDPNQM